MVALVMQSSEMSCVVDAALDFPMTKAEVAFPRSEVPARLHVGRDLVGVEAADYRYILSQLVALSVILARRNCLFLQSDREPLKEESLSCVRVLRNSPLKVRLVLVRSALLRAVIAEPLEYH